VKNKGIVKMLFLRLIIIKVYIMSYAKLVTFAAIASMFFMSFTSSGVRWDFLGQKTVDFGVDRDQIVVTAKEGVFKKIKLQVRKAPVEFKKVVVHYRNGSIQTIEMRDHIRAGGETRAIDLEGNDRVIKKVVFYYNSKIRAGRKGVVKLYGFN
jgi:hypothetical protein